MSRESTPRHRVEVRLVKPQSRASNRNDRVYFGLAPVESGRGRIGGLQVKGREADAIGRAQVENSKSEDTAGDNDPVMKQPTVKRNRRQPKERT